MRFIFNPLWFSFFKEFLLIPSLVWHGERTGKRLCGDANFFTASLPTNKADGYQGSNHDAAVRK
jgi:hypothetical protein